MRSFLRQDDKFADLVCGDGLWSLFVDIFLRKFLVSRNINFLQIRFSLRCDCFVPRNDPLCGLFVIVISSYTFIRKTSPPLKGLGEDSTPFSASLPANLFLIPKTSFSNSLDSNHLAEILQSQYYTHIPKFPKSPKP